MTDKKTSGPPPDAIPLSEAMAKFLPAEMWEEHARAADVLKNMPKRPSFLDKAVREWEVEDASYKAAYRPGTARADLNRVQNKLVAAMKAKLEAGELIAFGQEDPPFGPWREIPAPAWRQMRIIDFGKGKARAGENTVHGIHVLPPDAEDHMPKGMPGRPSTGREIIAAEFQRRVEAGEIASSLAAEAKWFAEWYRKAYPRRDCPTAKTIENNLRDAWRTVHRRTA